MSWIYILIGFMGCALLLIGSLAGIGEQQTHGLLFMILASINLRGEP